MAVFKHPSTLMIVGGTSSGKTVLTKQIIRNHTSVFSGMPNKPSVLWLCGVLVHKERIPNVKSVTYHEGMISQEELEKAKPDIVVVDDLCNELSDDKMLQNMFTKFSHHLRFTIIYITQSMFLKGQCILTRNTHYIILMRNPGDKRQIDILAGQLYPRRKRLLEHFHESYDDATSNMYGYLVVDISPTSCDRQKLLTDILPDEKGVVKPSVYVPT